MNKSNVRLWSTLILSSTLKWISFMLASFSPSPSPRFSEQQLQSLEFGVLYFSYTYSFFY